MHDAVGQLLPHLNGIEIDEVVDADSGLVIIARVRSRQAGCQACAVPSSRVHSRYRRTVADAPVAGRPTRIVLWVRRFFCDNAACQAKTFAEQVDGLTRRWSRVSEGLRRMLTTVGLALAGRAGARLAAALASVDHRRVRAVLGVPSRTDAGVITLLVILPGPAKIATMGGTGRRADVFVDDDEDPRTDVSATAGERDTLVGFLRWQRETLELKCSGLGAADLARRSVEPSTMSLLGLVRHMADVERGWFRSFMAGEEAPPRFQAEDEGDRDFDGAVADPGVVAEAWRAWREEIAYADRFVAEAPDLDLVGKELHPWLGATSLRWVLVHMIEEYARHNGHADLLRERIDGRLGQ